jgi:hypothetical protein
MLLMDCWAVVSTSISEILGGERDEGPSGHPLPPGGGWPQMMIVSSPRDLIHRSVRPGLVSPLVETSDHVGNRVEAKKGAGMGACTAGP